MLNILHISDLHYTSSPSGQLRDAANAAVRLILELASTLKANGTLNADTCVFITGDIVQTGRPAAEGQKSDFDAVQEDLLKPLLDILSITPDRVYFVPGNHEIDRDSIAEGEWLKQGQYPIHKVCERDLEQDLCIKLSAYFQFIDRYRYQSVTSERPRIASFECDGQQIVCFNGLVGSYSRKGYGDKGELFVLASEFVGALSVIKKNAIVLTHHPLSWFADGCSVDLKEFFSGRHCRLFTGHIHDRGLDWTEMSKGDFATVQAGASAEVGTKNQVAVAWLPASNSVAVRHYCVDVRAGSFSLASPEETQVAPQKSRQFFESSEAFFDPAIIEAAAEAARELSESELQAVSGRGRDRFVAPDIARFPEDQFSGQRISISSFESDDNNRVISGEELSGKSALIHYLAVRINTKSDILTQKIAIVLDYRLIEYNQYIKDILIRRLTSFGLLRNQADYILKIGKVDLFFDNFDPSKSIALANFNRFFDNYPNLRWTVSTRGAEKYMPSRSPAALSRDRVTYYQLIETTLPTVLKMIENHDGSRTVERPRAIVEQVFRSINNLRAPRTIFYVNSLIDVFLSDGSVEPLNRYLLIENLLSDRIRSAHKDILPNQPVDMEMLEAFIGQMAHLLMQREDHYLTKAQFYTLVEDFVERKGIQRKRFDADVILDILTRSFVLRDYDVGFGFMMLSIEDYFLAKHMGKDSEFRSYIMSTEGLLTYPSVAEFYVAQNPSDQPRIDEIFALIDQFQNEVADLVNEMRESSEAAIRQAHPGGSLKLQDGIIERLGEIENSDEPTSLKFEDPKPVGRTKRVRFSAEERGAVFLQLGASILGVTRTLDQADRIAIFKRLRGALLTSIHSLPMIAQHLADGGEITFRGNSIKADYIGQLAIPENRFYLILRGMLYNLYKSFGTWSGSPSFFNAAFKLRSSEDSELVKLALAAQNIEADLSEALEFIPDIPNDIDSLILREIIVRLYLDAMTLVPLERKDEQRAINQLVEVTIQLNPPNRQDDSAIATHKAKLRAGFTERIGYNAYVGRLLKPSRH